MVLGTHFPWFPWEDEDKPVPYIFLQDVSLSFTQVPVPLQGIDVMWHNLQDKA